MSRVGKRETRPPSPRIRNRQGEAGHEETWVEFRVTDEGGLDEIRDLWAGLNGFNLLRAKHFRPHFEGFTFGERKAELLRIAGKGALRVDIARDPAARRDAGYCVSSVSREGVGDIESIFVEEAYRGRGIGSALVTRSLAWMDGCGAVKKRVFVSDGNEEAWGFYQRFGFYPRMMMLEQLPGGGDLGEGLPGISPSSPPSPVPPPSRSRRGTG